MADERAAQCMKAEGPEGELRVGYQRAALLGRWTLDATPIVPMTKFAITARVRQTDSFWSTQSPMTLTLSFGLFRWEWERVTPLFENGSVQINVYGKPHIIKE